jgi:hypothetical protein
VYVIEAIEKPRPLVIARTLVPKRILYIDSEGWFITASDLYDRDGRVIARLNGASVAVWPFKRIFETAMVDEDVVNRFSTVVFIPGLDGRNALYLNMGAIDRNFFTPARMVHASH